MTTVVECSLIGSVTDGVGKTLLDSPRTDLSRFADCEKADLEVLVTVGRTLEDPVNGLLAGICGGAPLAHQFHDQKASGVAYDLFTNSC
jgi:hypothetical protein